MKIKLSIALKPALAAPAVRRSKVVEWEFEGAHFEDEYVAKSKALKSLKGIQANIYVEVFKHTYYRLSEEQSMKQKKDSLEYQCEIAHTITPQRQFRSLALSRA